MISRRRVRDKAQAALTVKDGKPRAADGQAAVVALLAVVIVAMLGAAATGVAVHHSNTTKVATAGTGPGQGSTTTGPTAPPTTLATPAGFERLLDEPDHLSLAVPPGWQAPSVSSNTLAHDLQALKATNPSLVPLLDTALAALTQIQIGVFAFDASTRTTMYSYGLPLPGVTSADEIPTADITRGVESVGGKNVQISHIRLPVGPAGQVTAQITVNAVTVYEVLDYFVLSGRLVSIAVATRGTTSPVSLLRQIEPTLAPA